MGGIEDVYINQGCGLGGTSRGDGSLSGGLGQQSAQGRCPCCGYCPHCGRRDAIPPASYPWLNPYPYAIYYTTVSGDSPNTGTVTCSGVSTQNRM